MHISTIHLKSTLNTIILMQLRWDKLRIFLATTMVLWECLSHFLTNIILHNIIYLDTLAHTLLMVIH